MARVDGEIITSEQLRIFLTSDFGSVGGGRRLAVRLGVSASTASNLLSGNPKSSLVKVAALYGFERHGDGTWIASKVSRDPRDVGYQHRWTNIVLEDLRALMSKPKGERPRVSDVARRAGVSASTMRGIMSKADIKLRQGDRA